MSVVGQRFGYREKPRTLGVPLEPVEVIQEGPPRSNQVRVQHLQGEYKGLKHWISRSRLVVPWEEAPAFMQDEHHLLAAFNASDNVAGSVPYEAADTVFAALYTIFNDELILCGWSGYRRQLLTIRSFESSVEKLKLNADDLLVEPYAYLDRHGHYWALFPVAEKLAKLFCQRYPKEILSYLHAEENKLRQQIVAEHNPRRPNYAEERLHGEQPIFALVREWCGENEVNTFNEVQHLRDEVFRLRNLVLSVTRWLRESGHPVKASLVIKELDIDSPDLSSKQPNP